MFQTIQTIYFLCGYDPGNMSVSSYLLLLSWAQFTVVQFIDYNIYSAIWSSENTSNGFLFFTHIERGALERFDFNQNMTKVWTGLIQRKCCRQAALKRDLDSHHKILTFAAAIDAPGRKHWGLGLLTILRLASKELISTSKFLLTFKGKG